MVIKVNGDIIGNDYKEAYDWWGVESTCPKDIADALDRLPAGEKLELHINSRGGDVMAGQEIYTMLADRGDVETYVDSWAASAASLIAVAGHCVMSPVGLIMIHNVSTFADGNKNDMARAAETLKRMDEAIAGAYVRKTGKSRDEILRMMDRETWLPAERAVELGFADEIGNEGSESPDIMVAGANGLAVTPKMMEEFKSAKAKEAAEKAKIEALREEILADIDDYGV